MVLGELFDLGGLGLFVVFVYIFWFGLIEYLWLGVWVELVGWLFWCDCWLRGLRLFSCYYIVCVGLVAWFVLCFVVVVLLLWGCLFGWFCLGLSVGVCLWFGFGFGGCCVGGCGWLFGCIVYFVWCWFVDLFGFGLRFGWVGVVFLICCFLWFCFGLFVLILVVCCFRLVVVGCFCCLWFVIGCC